METIDLTPTWREWNRTAATLIRAGQIEAVKHLLPDFENMAKLADAYNPVSMDFNAGDPDMPWTDIVVHPVIQEEDGIRKALQGEKPDYWSAYTVTAVDRLEWCIADFRTEADAVHFAKVLKLLAQAYQREVNVLRLSDAE